MASTSDTHVDDLEVTRIRTKLISCITRSSWNDVVKIYEQEPRAHKIKISKSGNTALHTAVESGREDTVEQLVKLITESSSEDPVKILSIANGKGNTPLYLAASLGSLRMCKCITGDGKYKQLLGSQNRVEGTPLCLAARHGKKDAFLLLYEICDKTQVHDYCVAGDGETVLIYAIKGGHFGKNNKPLDAENPTEGQGNEDHDHHCSSNGAPGPHQPPSNDCRCLSPIKLIISKALLLILSRIIPAGSSEIRKLKEKKERHIWSLQIMNKLVERAARYSHQMNPKYNWDHRGSHSEYEYFARDRDYYDHKSTPILIAASNGIAEMVEKILQVFPMAIHDMDGEGKNIVQLAIENRQSHIYDFLLKSSHLLDKGFAFANANYSNRALYLAAVLKFSESWLLPSSMLQMQWEVKWYEYVKNSLPSNVSDRRDYRGKTPDQIFEETHKTLLENSKAWLNSTCNSCSFIAALIATVTFASAATVPGGVNQDTGKPIFQHHLVFRFFAMSSLVALCSSFISLLIFFALLTSKCQYKDFSKNMPRNLFFGLTSLFLSMAAMLSCFISGHFLMLDNQLKYYAAVPVYTFTFLVITFLSLQQLPSYVALVRATFQKVPQRIYKETL